MWCCKWTIYTIIVINLFQIPMTRKLFVNLMFFGSIWMMTIWFFPMLIYYLTVPLILQIIFTNVGNPHALGQKPLTFPRQVCYTCWMPVFKMLEVWLLDACKMLVSIFQVIALCQAPFLLDDPNVGLIFPADAIARAKQFLAMTSGGLGIFSQMTFNCYICTSLHYASLSPGSLSCPWPN